MPPYTQPALLEVQTTAGVTTARLNTKALDEANALAVGDELYRLAKEADGGELRLNLAALEYLSSAGVGILLLLHHKLRGAGGRLNLRNVHPAVYEVFEVTGLVDLLDVHPAAEVGCGCG